MPLAGTTARHCVLSTQKAVSELGYRPVIDQVFDLDHAHDAVATMKKQGHFGKIVIRVGAEEVVRLLVVAQAAQQVLGRRIDKVVVHVEKPEDEEKSG